MKTPLLAISAALALTLTFPAQAADIHPAVGDHSVGVGTAEHTTHWSAMSLPLTAAAADSLSTWLVVGGGLGVEANPLVNPSPVGLLGIFVVKAGMVWAADAYLAPENRATAMAGFTGVWGAATVNNLLIAAGATGPAAIAVGVVSGAGLYLWERTRQREMALPEQQSPVPCVVKCAP
jgi:hypothetical protein